MACNTYTEKMGGKLTLNVECGNCPGTPSLGNKKCMDGLVEMLLSEKRIKRVILRKEFNRVYEEADVEKLYMILSHLQKAVKSFSLVKGDCDACLPERKAFHQTFLETVYGDPIKTYHLMHTEVKRIPKSVTKDCKVCTKRYHEALKKAMDGLEELEFLKEDKSKSKDYKEIYANLFHSVVYPGFIDSLVDTKIPKGAKLLETYTVGGDIVSIYDTGDPEYLYEVTPAELLIPPSEVNTINTVLNKIMAVSPEEVTFSETSKMRRKFHDLAIRFLKEAGIEDNKEKLADLAGIIVRYTIGLGLLEAVLTDHKLQDIYVDSPGNLQLHGYHEKFEECRLNISLSKNDRDRLASRLRALSGRPFDESYPVLDANLSDFGTRVCGVCAPATYSGVGFAFRRHRPLPWTLPKFIENGMIDAYGAGLLSFFVDGQSSILVTGARASGKTSLLGSLFSEILPNFRIIVIEDTAEIPVDTFKQLGYKIEHLRTRPPLTEEAGFELSANQALRTALRLGESVLVLGEVRGHEAKALFEAMRIGAAGNAVMGTIHGSSAYDTWDRIVNDLGVPTTSFKATDIVVACAPLRRGDDVKRNRRVVEITEIRKHWTHDPLKEDGFKTLMRYDPKTDSLKVVGSLKDSEAIQAIARAKGISMNEALENIAFRGVMKEAYLTVAKKLGKQDILEADFVAEGNKQYLQLIKGKAKPDYDKVFKQWYRWLLKRAEDG